MKNILVIIIFIFSMYAEEPTEKLLDEMDNNLKCANQYKIDEIDKIEECIKNKIEIIINSNYKYKKQLFVFASKKRAEKKAQDLNCTYKKKKFKGHPKLVDGDYYVVFCKSKITINIDNKILKSMPENRVKILKAKLDCYDKYKNEHNKLINCLNEESIYVIQIHALLNKSFCEKAKKECNKTHKCQCIEKNINSENYHALVETIDAFKEKNDIIKKIKHEKLFKLKKPEILIK